MTPTQFSNAVTGAIGGKLNEKSGTIREDIPILGGKGLGDVYQLGVSMASSRLGGATRDPITSGLIFFGSAASSGLYDAKERGATDEQAIKYGILSGLAETAGELLSLEHLVKIGNVEVKGFFNELLMQAGIEASEEGMTSLMNNFSDRLVMADKSNFNVLVNQLMTEYGLSEEEAKKQARKSIAYDIVYDMLGGAITGGLNAGGEGVKNTALNRFAEAKYAKAAYGSDPSALVNKTLEADPSNAFAQKMQERLGADKKLSGGQLAKLSNQYEQALREGDITKIQQAAANRLTELGETGDVDALSNALTKRFKVDFSSGVTL